MLMVIALGVLPASCGVRWRSQEIPAAIRPEQNAIWAATDSVSSGARYAAIPESDIDAADSPSASINTPPESLWICEGTRFQPADFKTSFKTRSSVRGSGSGNTANAKFCPAKGFNAVLNSACCFGDRERGCLNFSKASAASEAAFSAVAVRSFCLESSVSTPAMCSSLAFKSNVNCLSLAFSNSDWASAACEVLRIAKRVVSTIKTAARAAKASPHSIALFQKSADAESCATLDARASISDTCSPSDDVALSLIALSCVAIVVIVAWPWGRKL